MAFRLVLGQRTQGSQDLEVFSLWGCNIRFAKSVRIPKDRPLHVASRVFNQNGVLIGMVMNISLKCTSSRCASITILEWPLSNHQQLTRIFLECWKTKKQQIWKITHLCVHKFPRETDEFPYVAMFLNLLEGILPVVPHKAVAEVSKIGHYRRGELLWCVDGRANPLMGRKVFGVVFYWNGRLQWSPHPQLLDVVWCSADVVVAVV